MNAVVRPKFHTMHDTVVADARLANGQAHLESPEVPQWQAEWLADSSFKEDLGHAMSDALAEIKDRKRLVALITDLCVQGDQMPMSKAQDLLDLMRAAITDMSVAQAQKYVDNALEFGELL